MTETQILAILGANDPHTSAAGLHNTTGPTQADLLTYLASVYSKISLNLHEILTCGGHLAAVVLK